MGCVGSVCEGRMLRTYHGDTMRMERIAQRVGWSEGDVRGEFAKKILRVLKRVLPCAALRTHSLPLAKIDKIHFIDLRPILMISSTNVAHMHFKVAMVRRKLPWENYKKLVIIASVGKRANWHFEHCK
jgi:hypothetical protein